MNIFIFSKKLTLWSSLRVFSWPYDLPNCLEFTTPCLNVDDTEIFASSIDTDVLGNNINSDLENLGDWLTVNRPQLYPVRKYFLASQKHL